jgi:hypothetical protein
VPRTLSVSRASVGPEAVPTYLAALRALGARLRERGQSLWLFRHPTLPGTFLEFSESETPEQHRSRAVRDPDEAALETQLRTLAAYDSDARVLWEEVSLEKT